jgi:glycosyltransferase involved in cell wall biosynthesis
VAAATLNPSAGASRTRVLHVIQNLNYGGMERVLADIVRGLDRARFEPHVLVLQFVGVLGEELGEVAGVHVAGRQPRGSMLWPRGLAARIRGIAPDVVHTHSGVWYKASLAARLAGVRRLVHTEHGRRWPEPLQDRLIDRLAATRTDVVVAVSEVLARRMAPIVGRADKIRVVPNGVDTERFRPRQLPGPLRRELGLAPDVPVIGSIGRLEAVKGYDMMLRAFALLGAPAAGPRPVLVLVGDGAEGPRLRALARELEVDGRVRFLGWRADAAEAYAEFTVFSLSSHSEGMSVSLLEAMSAGVCPVVTDVGGNAAVLGEGLRHRLVPPADPAALAAGWRAALEAEPARRADGASARRRVESAFSVRTMVARYMALYLEDRPPA